MCGEQLGGGVLAEERAAAHSSGNLRRGQREPGLRFQGQITHWGMKSEVQAITLTPNGFMVSQDSSFKTAFNKPGGGP